MSKAIEVTRDGFDLVMAPERDGFTASIYRAGRQVPLERRLVATETLGLGWFEKFLRRQAGR